MAQAKRGELERAARPGWLIAEQGRARIGRERDAAYQAACYRAGQLLRRAPGG